MALHNGYGFRWRDLESQRKSGASARNLGGLRVTCPLYADNVARLASGRSLVEGGGSMFLPRFFRETSSERHSGPVHLVEGPEEAPGIARGITWPAPLACYQHNPTSDEE